MGSHHHNHESGTPHRHEGHSHSHLPPDNNFAFGVGVALNLGFVVAEVFYGLAAHSLALLSDAGHNMSDVLGLLIAWGAFHLSKAAPTKHRTYGLRRTSILAALSNGLFLLLVTGGIIWEALQRFSRPEQVAGSTVMWVAAAGIVVNGGTALLFMAGRERDLNIKGAFLHMASDAVVSLGVVLVGLAIGLTGWLWLDPAVGILIGLVIVWGTWGLLRESINLTLDAVPAGINPHRVEEFLAGREGVQSVHDLHIWGMSTTESALTVHLVMPQAPVGDAFLSALRHELHEQFEIGHATVQIEWGDGDCRQCAAESV